MALRRLLAVTHAASVTGAPMNLAHFLAWVTRHTPIEVHTLVLQDGPLVPRFEQVGGVTVVDRTLASRFFGTAHLGFRRLGLVAAEQRAAQARFAPLRRLGSFDVAYLNSATSIQAAPYLPPAQVVVSHVHELDVALRTMEAEDAEAIRGIPDAWIAASAPVRDLLTGELALPADRVLLHEEFITARALADRTVSLREIESCRRQLPTLPTSAAIVMGCGTLDWRKGPDLFIQVACEVRRRTRRPVHFVWLGGEHRGTDWERVRSDRDRAGADHVHFIEVCPDPVPWMATADVFALTSREDPLPLVCLESAVVGTPIVTYRNGGIPGLLTACGVEAARNVIDHLDAGAMADRILELLHSSALRDESSAHVRHRVVHQHDVGVAAPRLLADLEALTDRLDAGPASA